MKWSKQTVVLLVVTGFVRFHSSPFVSRCPPPPNRREPFNPVSVISCKTGGGSRRSFAFSRSTFTKVSLKTGAIVWGNVSVYVEQKKNKRKGGISKEIMAQFVNGLFFFPGYFLCHCCFTCRLRVEWHNLGLCYFFPFTHTHTQTHTDTHTHTLKRTVGKNRVIIKSLMNELNAVREAWKEEEGRVEINVAQSKLGLPLLHNSRLQKAANHERQMRPEIHKSSINRSKGSEGRPSVGPFNTKHL